MARFRTVALLLFASLLAASPGRPGSPGSAVVARVNGVAITADQLQGEMLRLLPMTFFHQKVSPEKMEQLRRQALDHLIDKELKLEEAKRLGLEVPDAEVEARLKQAIDSFPSREAFDARLKQGGVTVADLRAEIRRRKLVERAEQAAVKGVAVGEKEARAYYDANPERFVEPEQLHLRTILLKVAPLATKEEEKAVEAKAKWLAKQIRSGELAFEAAAKQYSQADNAKEGGDMGWLHKGQLGEKIEPQVLKLAPGEVGGPFRVFKGYYLVQLVERRPARTVPFEEVRDKLVRQLTERRREERRRAWLQGLRAKAKVEILLPEAAAKGSPAAGKGAE